MNIDYERLKRDLIDYIGPATAVFDVAYADLIRIESASHSELIEIAEECGFDLSDYEEYSHRRHLW